MVFEDELSISKVLSGQAESKNGLNSALLYSTEPLDSSEHDHRTLRVNIDAMGYEEEGKYPGTLYPAEGQVDDNIWLSFESGDNFPNSTSAQSILAEDPVKTASAQVVHYTTAPIEGLENYSSENEIRGLESRVS